MIKWEKKLIEFVEKHMLLLAILFVSGLALLLRRQNIWYYTEDYIYYFDMHEHNIQTPFYYFLVQLCGHGFMSPLHGIKWIVGMADFAVAVLSVLICGNIYKRGWEKKLSEQIKLMLLYAALLLAPVIYVRGCVWARIDALAFAFLLLAAYIWEFFGRKGTVVVVLLAGIGTALYAPFLLLVIWYNLCVKKEEGVTKYVWLAVIAVVLVLESVSSTMLGITWQQGLLSVVWWCSYHPHTGVLYQSIGEWLWQMLMIWAYGISVISILAAYRKKIPYMAAAVLQILLFICCGVALGW